MLERIKQYAFYGDVSREDFDQARPKIEANNRLMALVFGSAAALLISVMLTLSLFQDSFVSSRPVYAMGVLLSVAILVVANLAKQFPVLSYVAVYMAIAVFLSYGIAVGTFSRPEEQTVTFMVLLVFVPLIFVDRPVRMAASLVVGVAIFIMCALHTKTGSILSVDITDALIFGMLSIVSETVVNRAKIRGFALENQLHEMSETDQLTGLKNRNCYERRISELGGTYQGVISCIYIDANGLHELNNTQGHAAGDAMLIFVADAVREQFGAKSTFRIGGDEFVAFALGLGKAEVEARIEALTAKVTSAGYHVAVGMEYASGATCNLSQIISTAEAAMYADKTAYYKLHDRRRARTE